MTTLFLIIPNLRIESESSEKQSGGRRTRHPVSGLQRRGGEVQQIAALAGEAAQPTIVAGHLAQLEYRGADELAGVSLAQVLGKEIKTLPPQHKGAVTAEHRENLMARHPKGGYAVLLDTATWDPADGRPGSADASARALRNAGWTVAVATAGTTPDRVWEAL
jgi:hypothetical protein